MQGELAQPYASKDLLEQALKIAEIAYSQEDPKLATCLNNLGVAWNTLGETKKAIDYFERALAIDEKTYGSDHPNVAIDVLTTWEKPGVTWGKPRKPSATIERALAIDEKTYGPDHPNVADIPQQPGRGLGYLGRGQESHLITMNAP